MTMIMTRILIVNNRFTAVTGAFGRRVKNSNSNDKAVRYSPFNKTFLVDRWFIKPHVINSHRLVYNQTPIDLFSIQVSSQYPAVSSPEACQTPAR